jgi:divalent metal cation (Fe/Co/Zn/Cd) transporter
MGHLPSRRFPSAKYLSIIFQGWLSRLKMNKGKRTNSDVLSGSETAGSDFLSSALDDD